MPLQSSPILPLRPLRSLPAGRQVRGAFFCPLSALAPAPPERHHSPTHPCQILWVSARAMSAPPGAALGPHGGLPQRSAPPDSAFRLISISSAQMRRCRAMGLAGYPHTVSPGPTS